MDTAALERPTGNRRSPEFAEHCGASDRGPVGGLAADAVADAGIDEPLPQPGRRPAARHAHSDSHGLWQRTVALGVEWSADPLLG